MNLIDKIEIYLGECLAPTLSQFGVSEGFKNEVLNNVRMQIYSFCSHWNDVEFRNGLFVVGLEEGMFYEPMSPINPFIVVAIRNSLVETVQSKDYERAGLSHHMEDDFVKAVTKQAIEYFMDIRMDEVCHRFFIEPSEDLYGLVAQKYPLAWAALVKIGNTTSSAIAYPKVETIHHPDTFARFAVYTNGRGNSVNLISADGYSPDIDEELKGALHYSVSKRAVFFTENFKSVTRNFEKLLCVIEYVLYNHRDFVTSNYYIANGYIAKRSPLLRAGHTADEKRRNLENLTGLRKTHREVIREVLNKSLV